VIITVPLGMMQLGEFRRLMSSKQSMAAGSRLGQLFVSRDNQITNEYSLSRKTIGTFRRKRTRRNYGIDFAKTEEEPCIPLRK